MNHPDYVSENEYLQAVLEYIKDSLPALAAQKEELDARVSYALKHMNIDNPEQFNEWTVNLSLLDGQKTKVAQMQFALGKPYFARVDFKQNNIETHYIGKMTLLDDLKMLITDWRAPVSSLYYEGRIGQSSYDCPDGTITGEITLKRQYQINGGKLEGFTDIDITANDDFLQAALGASKDRRLGDIVATIQAEQNKIIRAPLYQPLLVQGAAGRGKT
ncbi:MAG: DNA helicase, partial [Firmicutes bacterium]|nr:DNA helicase [Bacillota bacterium]